MTLRRWVAHASILFYLYVSLGGLWFTMTHTVLPPPQLLTFWSYGMMGVYQGYETYNPQLRAEALAPDGSWRGIDLHPLMPMHFGEFVVRGWLDGIRRQFGGEVIRERYRRLAAAILRQERMRGRDVRAVRLFWDQWPRSPEGYSALRLPPFTESVFLAQFP